MSCQAKWKIHLWFENVKKWKAFERKNFLHDPGVARCLRYFIQIFSCLNNCFLSFGIPVLRIARRCSHLCIPDVTPHLWPWSCPPASPIVSSASVMFVSTPSVVRKGGIRVATKNPVVVCFSVLLMQSFYDRQALIMAPMTQEIPPSTCLNHCDSKFPILHKSMFIVHISLMSESEKWNNLI